MKVAELNHPNSRDVKAVHSRKSHFSPPTKWLLWPSIIYICAVTQVPFLMTLYYSVQNWNIMRPDKGIVFAGVSNFIDIIGSAEFWLVLKNTFVLTIVSLCLCMLLGLGLALLLNRNFYGKGIARTLIIAPFFIMPAVSGIVWKAMILNPNFGFSAYLFQLFGGQSPDWLGRYPLETIMCLLIWQWTPFFMLVLLAGLQSVSQELLEASHLDGATRLQQFANVVIPHLLRYIEVAALLGLISIMQAFGEIYVTTSGGPGYASTNLTFYLYRLGFQNWDIGKASALGVIIVILTTILMMMLFKFLRRRFGGELS
ncbi:carbohydrate ABC transporter permease [Paenibacillus chitinolyticus]